MINKKYFLLLVLAAQLFHSVANSQDNYFLHYRNKLESILREKVYVHTDRDIYTAGEDIWYKLYLVDSKTHNLIAGINTVYVDLVSKHGEIFFHKPVLIVNGSGYADINIPDSINTGVYSLYAYTRYMKNFGIESSFKKDITISWLQQDEKAGKVGSEDSPVVEKKVSSAVSLQFMPEGGYLSDFTSNNLAFKITGMDGKGINGKGIIKDTAGNFIRTLESYHHGMGRILFRPQQGMRYYAVLEDFPLDTFFLPLSCNKPQLEYAGIKDSIVHFNLRDVLNYNNGNNFYLAVTSKGELTFYLERKLNGTIGSIRIHQRVFKPGLNKMVLLDGDYVPLAERLFFIPGIPQLEMEIQLARDTIITREKTEIILSWPKETDKNTGGSFSMAVVNLDQIGKDDIPAESILSFLELSSEIKGTIESPGYYFSQPYDSVSHYLDLLLLTQGWTNYIWDEAYIDSLPDLTYNMETGVTIAGNAKRLLLNRALEEGNIVLFVPGGLLVQETTTDSTGYFKFENLILFDSTEIVVQSRSKSNKQNSRLIDVKTVVSPPPDYPELLDSFINTAELDAYKESAYLRFLNNSYYDFDKDHILLEEVTVVGKKKEEDDGHFRIYSQANNVIDMDDFNSGGISDLFMFLQGRVPGVMVSGDEVFIRGGSGPALILIDGLAIDGMTARNISLYEVDKIEILKDASNTAVFGVRGGNGVVAIYTKRGEIIMAETPVFDIIAKAIEGYAKAREFHVPDYENPETNLAKIDRRATLFWEPNISPDSTGLARISFFNSDDPGKIAIITEGVSFDGRPGVARGYYWVIRE